MDASAHVFDQAIALTALGDDRFEGHTSDAYWNMVGPFGGITAATALNAVLQHPALLGQPVALTVNYAAALAKGRFIVVARAARTNRSTQHWSIEIRQDDADALLLLGRPYRARPERARVLRGRRIRGTFIELHDDVRTQFALNLHGLFRAQENGLPILGGFELDALLGELAQLGQTPYLKPAGVSQDRTIPMHEIVQIAVGRDDVGARAQHEVEGVTQDDLRAHVTQFVGGHGFYCAVGPNRHECRRFHGAPREAEASSPSRPITGQYLELHVFICFFVAARGSWRR